MIPLDQTAIQELTRRLTEDVKYPATKQGILDQLTEKANISDDAKRFLSDNLPNRSYSSGAEALAALPM